MRRILEERGMSRRGRKLPPGDKQPRGFHGSARRAKSALISGSRACRKETAKAKRKRKAGRKKRGAREPHVATGVKKGRGGEGGGS